MILIAHLPKMILVKDFDSCPPLHYAGVRLESCAGAENKLRIVYESAVDRTPGQPACIKRFPAALFAWQVGPVDFLMHSVLQYRNFFRNSFVSSVPIQTLASSSILCTKPWLFLFVLVNSQLDC